MKNRDLWETHAAHIKSRTHLAWAISSIKRARAQALIAGYPDGVLASFDTAIVQCTALAQLIQDQS